MRLFVASPEFKTLNIGVAMDEGLAHPENMFVVYYGERTPLWARFQATGPVGHGSKLIPNTAIERLLKVARRLSDIRQDNVEKLASDSKLRLGDVTTVNVTVMQGGTSSDGGKTFAPNVIPSDASLTVDIRITPTDFEVFMEELYKLTKDNNLQLDFPNLGPGIPVMRSGLNSESSNRWYELIEASLKKYDAKIEKTIFPAATDSRYIRNAGVPAFGFSPMRRTPSLLHDHNEYLERKTYLEGVGVYTDMIPRLADAPKGFDSQSHL